jgi:O-antigen/teichoic acid export membrane protein
MATRSESCIRRDGSFAAGGRFSFLLAALLNNALLAHLLTPAELGVYFVAFSVVNVGVIVATFGFGQLAVRQLSTALASTTPGDVTTLARALIRSAAATTAGTVLVLGCCGHLIAGNPATTIAAGCLLAAVSFERLLAEMLRGCGDVVMASFCGGPLSAGGCVILLAVAAATGVEMTPASALAVFAGCRLPVLLFAMIILRQRLRPYRDAARSAIPAARLLGEAWPMALNNLARTTIMQVDLWLLTAVAPAETVGIYGLATRLATLLQTPQYVASATMMPRIAPLYESGQRRELALRIQSVSTLCVLPVLAAVILLPLVGRPMLRLFFGESYTDGLVPLIILAFGHLVCVGCGLASISLLMTGHQRAVVAVVVVTGGCHAALCAVGVWQYGMIGAAAGAAIGMALRDLVLSATVRHVLGFWPLCGMSLRRSPRPAP